LRKAALIVIAGTLLPAGFGFAFCAAALAGEQDSGSVGGEHAGVDKKSNGDSGKRSGDHGSRPDTRGADAQPGPHPYSVTYEANRNMLNLHVKLGAPEHRDGAHSMLHLPHQQHEGQAWTIGRRDSSEKALNDVYLRNIAAEGWRERHSEEALEKSVNPVAERYQNSVFGQKIGATTIVGKTKLAIGELSFLPNEVLAVGADPASIERAAALGFKADPQVLTSDSSEHIITRFIVPPGMDAVRGRDLLSTELPGQRFELNKVYRLYRAAARDEPVTLEKSPPGNAARCAEDRCFPSQAIGWKETLAPCAQGLKVGVIDTDIDEAHPAFAGRNIHRFDFAPDGRLPPPNWHGTAVLSLLAGSPLTGTPGLIPDAEFFSANVFFADERGEMASDTISLLKALDWMKAFDVKLINMSFSGPRDDLIAEAIEHMSERGVLFVAAAGNEGPTADPSYPAAYPQVIAVTAVTKDLHNYRYANRGDHIDVAAPGVDIWTAMPGGRAGYHSGTSFAAPYVTAVLAVQPRESLQPDKAALLDGMAVIDLGEQGRDPIYGRGLLLAPDTCTAPSETVASAAQ
jgi:hypothetical protein